MTANERRLQATITQQAQQLERQASIITDLRRKLTAAERTVDILKGQK